VGSVGTLPARAAGVRLADAVRIFLGTIATANTRRAYASALDRMVRDFGADGDVGLLNPDRVSGWFDYVWGGKAPKTYNLRLTAVSAACAYWRDQQWLTADPVSRLRARPTAPDNSKAMTAAEVAELLGMDAPLRERVFWSMLYESAARAEEILNLDIEDLDTVNRCATVTRKGGARDVIYWQTGTARLLPRLIAGRKSGPLFLTDRKAKPSVAKTDTDDSTGRARLSYRRAATLLEEHTAGMRRGPFTLHQLRHSRLTHAAEKGASTPMLMALSGHTSVRSLVKYAKVSAEALGRWQADTDPAARRRRSR
jgi:integrase